MSRLDGKVVLVTSGARGIGVAIARAVVTENAKVVIGDVSDRGGEALTTALGASAKFVHLDVSKPEDWEAAVATAVKTYGALDVLVNNAGIKGDGPIDEYSRADRDQIVAVNLTDVFHGIVAAIPALKAAGCRAIINVSALAGPRAGMEMPGYLATKFAVHGRTMAAAPDLARYRIRVDCIYPDIVHTPLGSEGPKVRMGHLALERVGNPIEIANLAVFLASDAPLFAAGAEFIADRGNLAGLIRQSGEPSRRAGGAGR